MTFIKWCWSPLLTSMQMCQALLPTYINVPWLAMTLSLTYFSFIRPFLIDTDLCSTGTLHKICRFEDVIKPTIWPLSDPLKFIFHSSQKPKTSLTSPTLCVIHFISPWSKCYAWSVYALICSELLLPFTNCHKLYHIYQKHFETLSVVSNCTSTNRAKVIVPNK